jgi:Protein of unknown function (DUF3014)
VESIAPESVKSVGVNNRLEFDSPEPELELRPGGSDTPVAPQGRRPSALGALAVLVLLAGAIIVFYYWRPLPFARPAPEQVRLAADASGSQVPTEFGPVPELGVSDEFVRALVRQLSSHPALVSWLASDQLVRAATVVVDKIAIGSSPSRELRALGPATPFLVTAGPGVLRIDPKGYARYDTFANVIDSIDTEGASRAFRRLRPLFQQAFDELGYTNLTFDDRLALALGRLVDTPVPEGDVAVLATSVTFQFADPELEALSPAQKHLLRMGPRNMRLVQHKIREFARAAGLTRGPGSAPSSDE